MLELAVFCGGMILGATALGIVKWLWNGCAPTQPVQDWNFDHREQNI